MSTPIETSKFPDEYSTFEDNPGVQISRIEDLVLLPDEGRVRTQTGDLSKAVDRLISRWALGVEPLMDETEARVTFIAPSKHTSTLLVNQAIVMFRHLK